jgi:hypothetical protein
MSDREDTTLGVAVVVYSGLGMIVCYVIWCLQSSPRAFHLAAGGVPTMSAVCDPCERSKCCCFSGRAGLATFRIIIIIYQVLVLAIALPKMFATPASTGSGRTRPTSLLTYTTWNYVLQTFWWALAASLSAVSLLFEDGGAVASSPAVRASRNVMHILLSVCLPASLVITLMNWSVLVPTSGESIHIGSELTWHGLNALCLLFEAATDSLLLHPAAALLLLLWAAAYIITIWITHALVQIKWPVRAVYNRPPKQCAPTCFCMLID